MQQVYVSYNPETGQIGKCYQTNDPDIVIRGENMVLVNRFPNVRSERIYNGVLCLKPRLSINLSKTNILADGVDEIEIIATLLDCQENEKYACVSIEIANQAIEIPLTNNHGSIRFASLVPGRYEIKVKDKRFRLNKEAFIEVIVDEVS